jgi:putative peptidoglycan lipid II flippase
MVFLLTIPSSIGLAVLGHSIIGAIYQGGKFVRFDTDQTAVALSCYAIGLAGYSALKVLSPSFYALGDARTPMIISLLSIGINFAVAWSLTRYTNLGHAGLALSTSTVALFGFVAQFWILRNRIGGIYGRNLMSTIVKVTLASVAMGFAVWASSGIMERIFGVSRWGRIADLSVSIPLGLGVFYGFSKALRIADLEPAFRAIAGPVVRRIKT